MSYLFTSESVSEGHPDKIADQISDALLDNFLVQDPDSKVACETLVTTGLVIISGEVKSKAYVDVQKVARQIIARSGYTKAEYQFEAESCGVITTLHEQSPDINQGVDRGPQSEMGAGDQGMMFGYATNETENYMPLALDLSHRLLHQLATIRKEGKEMTYLRPDSKAQVTIEYEDDGEPKRIDTIVISTQHNDFDSENEMRDCITHDIKTILIPKVKQQLPENIQKLFNENITFHINPTGKFVIGGPHGDTGLTGRKIIVDTYGGKGAHGGGAFSGKDPSKVDRSAAYASRHIAKNLVAAGVADEILVQVSYAIGVAEPVSIYTYTFGKSNISLTDTEISRKVREIFDMKPSAIIERLKLNYPIYQHAAVYGHMGRTPEIKEVKFEANGQVITKKIETFTWEKLDYVDKIREVFNIKT